MYYFTLPTLFLLLALSDISLAQLKLCTTSNAIPLESVGSNSNGSGSAGSGGSSSYTSDNEEHLNGISDIMSQSTNDVSGMINSSNSGRRSIGKRALYCTKTETCVSSQQVLYCVDLKTTFFHGEELKGNLRTGDFTHINGETGNIYSRTTASTVPTPTARVNSASTTLVRGTPASETTSAATTSNANAAAPIQSAPSGGANGVATGFGGVVSSFSICLMLLL